MWKSVSDFHRYKLANLTTKVDKISTRHVILKVEWWESLALFPPYLTAGVDYLVVGRPITTAEDRVAAAKLIIDEINNALEGKEVLV